MEYLCKSSKKIERKLERQRHHKLVDSLQTPSQNGPLQSMWTKETWEWSPSTMTKGFYKYI